MIGTSNLLAKIPGATEGTTMRLTPVPELR